MSWRVVLSKDIPDGLSDVRRYTFVDLIEAQIMLDLTDELRPDPPAPRGRRGG